MEKLKLSVKTLLAVMLIAASILALTGCKQSAEVEPTTQPELLPEYKLYWNVDKDSFNGEDNRRKAEADGTFLMRMFADGEIVSCKVPDRPTAGIIDQDYLVALCFDESGMVSQVLDVDTLPVQQLGRKFYVQSVDGNTVHTNSSYRFDGMEESFAITDATGIYDMTGVSGDPGSKTVLQENDRIIALGDGQGTATDVYVFGREGINSRITRFCEQCQQEVSWSNWYHDDELPLYGGHYYLVNDVQLNKQHSIPEYESICLDLNGFTVTGKENTRIYSLHQEGVTLSVYDYSEAQTGKLVAWGEKCAQGACVWVRYGTFNLYGGTLDGSGAISNVNGVTVAVPKNSTMNMYGGTIIGGKAICSIKKDTGTAVYGMGGTMSVNGTLNLYDGTIRDGYACCNLNEKTGKYSQGYGGNIIASGGIINMSGGKIENGKAEGGGGNVYLLGKSEFNMSGGAITGGQVMMKGKNGGNMTVAKESTVNLSGGSISGGVSRNYSGNIQLAGTLNMTGGSISGGKVLDANTGKVKNDHTAKNLFVVNGKFYMSGGSIDGSVTVTDSAKGDGLKPYVCLSGTAKITGAKDGNNNLRLNAGNDGYSMDVKKLSKGAKIGITAEGKFTNKTAWANAAYFTIDKGGDICQVDGCLFVGRLGCLCGAGENQQHVGQCDGKLIPWQSWNSDKSLPGTDGYYYLMTDVACKQTNIKADAHTHLDLNGKTVTVQEGSRAYTTFNENSHLTVTDSGKTGKLLVSGQTAIQGMGVWIRYGSFTLYGGTIDASAAASTLSGVAIRCEKNTEFTMYGGKILGGTARMDEKGNFGTGGSVNVRGSFHMYGGTLESGCSESHGGNVIVENGAVFNLHGGTVTGGKNLNAGKSGGNIYVASAGEMTMTGGTVAGGLTQNIGGNIYCTGKLSISGGTVTGGMRYKAAEDGTVTTTYISGGNVHLVSGTMNMSGGLIEGHTAITSNNDKPAYLNVSGSARIIGGANDMNLALVALGTAPEPPVVNIEGSLSDDAMIGLVSTGFFSGPTTQDNADNFTLRGGLEIKLYEGRLAAGIQYNCVCGTATEEHKPGCDQEKKIWNAWTAETSLPGKDGYWFLMTDVTCGQTNIGADAHVHLDLNGHTVTGKPGSRIYANFNENSHLTVTDSSTEQTGRMIASGEAQDQGKGIWVRYGSVTMYGGTLDASQVNTTSNGAAVHVPAGSSFTMNGGKIISGTAALGGGIYAGGAVTVAGGEITRGQESTGSVLVLLKGKAAVLTVTGGIIDGATIPGSGGQTGAVTASDNSTVIMDGGTVKGMPCGMYLYDANLEMKSGSVGGAHVYINGNVNKGSTATVCGGTVENGMYLYRGSLNLSGNPVITGGYGLKLAKEKIFTLGDLTEGAQLLLTCEDGGRIVATEVADPTDVQYITGAVKDQSLTYLTDQGLYLSKGKFACGVCGGVYAGCQHTEMVEWNPVAGDLSVIQKGGHYYLTQDITLTGQLSIGENANIVLDLNGYQISRTGGRTMAMNKAASLTITDSVGTGSIACITDKKDNGMVLNINNANAVVTMYGGTLNGAAVTNGNNGATMNVAGTFKMYGGTVVGGVGNNGGAIRVNGTSAVFEMYDGFIYGGKANGLGHNIYLGAYKSVIFGSGQIAGGVYASSGTPKVQGDVVIDKALTPEGCFVPSYSLQLTGTRKLGAVNGLTEGARICISRSSENDLVAIDVADENQTVYFHLDDTECVRTYNPDGKTLRLTAQE